MLKLKHLSLRLSHASSSIKLRTLNSEKELSVAHSLPKNTLSNTLNLPNRDLRFQKNLRHISINHSKIIVNLGAFRTVITPDKIYMIDMNEANIQEIVSENSPNSETLPFFEFHALEKVLNAFVSFQGRKVELKEKIVNELCETADNFDQDIYVDSYNSGQELTILNALNIEQTELEMRKYKLKSYIEVIEELQEDEIDLKSLLISQNNKEFTQNVSIFQKEGEVVLETDLIQEMENLLDIMITQLEDLEENTKQTINQIEKYKELLRTKQNIIRNNVMMENLKLSRWQVAISTILLLVAFPSMNLDFPGMMGSSGTDFEGFFMVVGSSFFVGASTMGVLRRMPIYKRGRKAW